MTITTKKVKKVLVYKYKNNFKLHKIMSNKLLMSAITKINKFLKCTKI